MTTKIISQELASRIWTAHREIEVGRKLLADIEETIKADRPTPLEPYHRRRRYTLGVPNGQDGHRMLDVSPQLAGCVVLAHLAEKERELKELSIAAKIELGLMAASEKRPDGTSP